MGILLGNLKNCIVKNHMSIEYMGDQTILDTLPNIVLIEIWANSSLPAPPDSEEGTGYWMVKAENFNIGKSPVVTPILPASDWATNPNWLQDSAGTGEGSVMNDNIVLGGEWADSNVTVPGGAIYPEITQGKWYTLPYMDYAVDVNGNDVSAQSIANWDYRVNDIMICDITGDIDNATTSEKEKNVVCVFVRLKDNWVYPGEDVVIDVDIDGYAHWVDQAEWTGSDRKIKKNIQLIGKSLSGLNIYIFEYIDKKHGKGFYQGVMSDEVPRHAVRRIKGFDEVDYSKVDVDFKQIQL